MRSYIGLLASLAPCLHIASALPVDEHHGSPHHGPPHYGPPHHGPAYYGPTLYFLQNQVGGNHVVAVGMPAEGSDVAPYARTSTEGEGLHGIFGNVTAGPDSLFGQSAVVVSGDLLFTVNPGSKTVVMFSINSWDPMHPVMVGKPASTLGEFPMSVAYSPKLQTACVLNGGKVAGVTCFDVDYKKGLTALDKEPRMLPEGFMETTPPVGPPNTASQISFSPDESFLVATLKGNFTATPPVPGFVSVWPVSDGKVSTTATVSSLDSVLGPFGFGFFSENSMLVSDPTHGASVLSVASDLTVSSLATLALPDFGAACWAISTPDMKTGYVIDAASTQIAVVDAASNTISKIWNLPEAAEGGF